MPFRAQNTDFYRMTCIRQKQRPQARQLCECSWKRREQGPTYTRNMLARTFFSWATGSAISVAEKPYAVKTEGVHGNELHPSDWTRSGPQVHPSSTQREALRCPRRFSFPQASQRRRIGMPRHGEACASRNALQPCDRVRPCLSKPTRSIAGKRTAC